MGEHTASDGTYIKITETKKATSPEKQISFMDQYTKDGEMISTSVFIGDTPRRYTKNPKFDVSAPWECSEDILFTDKGIERYSQNVRYFSDRTPQYSVDIAFSKDEAVRVELSNPANISENILFLAAENGWQQCKGRF